MATPLADVLLSRSGAVDRLTLEAALRRLVEELAARHPAFAVPAEAFVAHAARWIRPDREPLAALAELQLDQLYLAFAAARGEPAAIAEIEANHVERARAALRSFDAATTDDALQRTRETLFVARGDRPPRIGEYAGRGDLAGWIRTTALREAFHLVAPTRVILAGGATVNAAVLDGYALPAADPAIELMKRQYGASFKTALAGALARLPEATRTTLRRYYVEGLGLEQIAALEGVVASTISRRLDKARRELSDETRRALAESLRISDDEVDSILELLDSRLELSRSALAGSP